MDFPFSSKWPNLEWNKCCFSLYQEGIFWFLLEFTLKSLLETLGQRSILGSMRSENENESIIRFTQWYGWINAIKVWPLPPYILWPTFMLTMWPQQHLAYRKEEDDVHGCWSSFVTPETSELLRLFGPFIEHLASLSTYNWISHGINMAWKVYFFFFFFKCSIKMNLSAAVNELVSLSCYRPGFTFSQMTVLSRRNRTEDYE